MNFLLIWNEIRHIMGWDDPNSFGYLFHSGSGSTLELGAWGTILWLWRTSCHERRWCLRHGRHDIADLETGIVHKVCWKHAGLPSKYGNRIREIQAKHKFLYLGKQPGRDGVLTRRVVVGEQEPKNVYAEESEVIVQPGVAPPMPST